MSKSEEIQAHWGEAAALEAKPLATSGPDPQWKALLSVPVQMRSEPLPSLLVGELLALTDGGSTALVRYPGLAGSAAVAARSMVDLHGAHIGKSVALVFEGGEAGKPVVTGVLREPGNWPLPEQPAQVEVDADGRRLLISAQHELVLRCGKASITLTRAGKVLIEGTHVTSRALGVNRVKGGSIQLN